MRAYMNGVNKAAFLQSLFAHRRADRIRQGYYWEHGRGCAVGCGIHSVMAITGAPLPDDGRPIECNHTVLGNALGVPPALIALQDVIFESLSAATAKEWPLCFAEAIETGADLSDVLRRTATATLREIAGAASCYRHVREAALEAAAAIECNWTNGNTPRGIMQSSFGVAVMPKYFYYLSGIDGDNLHLLMYFVNDYRHGTLLATILIRELRAVRASPNENVEVARELELV